jgi:hypothetical protein
MLDTVSEGFCRYLNCKLDFTILEGAGYFQFYCLQPCKDVQKVLNVITVFSVDSQ